MMGRRQSAIAEGVLITSPSPSTISGRPAMALPWRGGPRGWTGRSMCPAIAIQKRIACTTRHLEANEGLHPSADPLECWQR